MKTYSCLNPLFRLFACLALFFTSAGLVCALDKPLGPIGGSYQVTTNTSLARVIGVTAGQPGAAAGLQADDYIYGAFGQTFTPTGGYHSGVTQELGFAVDRAEGGDGILPLLVLRPGVGMLNLNVALPAAGAFGVAYPRNSPKSAAVFESSVAYLHTTAMGANGNLGYLTGWGGLALLGHPNWNDTTGAKPYRLSINKIRDLVVSQINAWVYAPLEDKLLNGAANPNFGAPHSANWELGQKVMFLSEYYAKTSDASVTAALQRGAEMCGNSIQYWKQPALAGNNYSPEYSAIAGIVGHNGVIGDYIHLGYGGGINMVGVHAFNGMAFARRVGMNMNARPRDGHYFGYNLHEGDTIPASIANALPSSITLPQYGADPVQGATITSPFWYDMSVHQKFVMQLNWLVRRSMVYNNTSNSGAVGYTPASIDPGDAGGRTPGALLGMAMYQQDVGGLDAADLGRLEAMKAYITVNYMRHQEAHAFCVGAQAFQALCAPYLSDRQQRYFMENWRFYFALSRTSTNGFLYVPARNTADNYLNPTLCAAVNVALPYAIANGNLTLVPGYNVNRTLANFKSPILLWPTLDARTAKVTTTSQDFQVDVCDGNGNVLAPGTYTASWTHVSGPATATFSDSTTANTTVTFPTVSATAYRIRLTVTRAGVPDLVEDIDISRIDPPVGVTNAIVSQPVNQSPVMGGAANFSVTMSGTGPFVYQWRLDGVPFGASSATSTLAITNVGSGHEGNYDCVISTPTGMIVSNPATLALAATLTRIQGGLRREVWTGITGTVVTNLTDYANFPRFPNTTSVVTSAEAPKTYGDNYGQKLSGWIRPPVSGSYRFFLSSDEASQVWLSTNDTAANKVQLINHTALSAYRAYDLASSNVALVAGQKYYIEILHKEGTGADHVSLAWQLPGEAAPALGSAPIDGVYLEYDSYQALLTNRWTFNETSGTTAADSVGGATATLYNSPTWVGGKIGGALSFNGVNQYAKATVNVSEVAYAASMWFRTTQSAGGLFLVVDEGGGNDRNLFLKDGNIYSYVHSGETISSTGQNYGDGQWHHVLHTFGGAIGGQKLYVDGVQVASGAKTASTFTWQTAVKIGYSTGGTNPYFNGQIDDVCIHYAGLGVADAVAMVNAALNTKPQISAATLTVAENSANGTTIGTISATDADAGQSLAYSIAGGNVGNRFAIHASTGVITVNGPLDYEFIPSYVLTVRAADNGTPSAYADALVTINVTNVNEAPVFTSNPLRGPSTPAGAACSGRVSASDPDSGDAFVISKSSGPAWLSVATDGTLSGTPAAGDIGLNTFVVRVTDSSSAWTEASLQILVVNVSTHPLWINPAGGSWPTAGNWMSGTVASGASMVADFSAPDITGNTSVTLDGSRTIGGLVFGDTDNQYGWTLAPGTGGTLTIDATSAPILEVFNQSATLGVPIAGTKGLAKEGVGLLSLTAANTYTGATSVNAGTFCVGNGTTVGSLSSSSAISITSGATAKWWHSTAGYTIANTISGSGQWLLKGTNSATALQQSYYSPTATNSGFTGELILDGALSWNISNPTRLGSGTIRVRNCGTLGVNGTSLSNTVIVENGAGWHHNFSGVNIVLGAMRLEGTNTLSGNIQLNQGTGVFLGDTSGANSTLGAYSTSNNTLSGVISGAGEFSMSRYTGWNGGTTMVVDFNLTGTASNTFTGLTVVDGQGAKASLRLMKTAGAVAIPGGNVVQLGNNTGGAANLRMGDTTTVGATRNQWNNQFGTTNGGVLLNFANASGQWMRFDLQGTNQSVAGLNAGSDVTQGSGMVQNQNTNAFDPGQDATLTLIGSEPCLYNGYIRDQDNGGNTRKLHIVKSGSGIQTFTGSQLTYSGTTTVTGGTLRINGTLANSPVTIGGGGKLDGTGTINTAVAVASGGTLAAGNDSIGTLTVANTVTLNSSATVSLRIAKSEGLLSADRVSVTGVSALALQGTLSVTLAPGSDPLDTGDRFTILSATGGRTGNFAAYNLPALAYNQIWNTGDIATDGTISVQMVPPTQSPMFTPDGGSYISAQSVTISSATDGATIRYTTDGSDPLTSGTAVSGTTPVTGLSVPCPATLTVRAYAFKSGYLDSEVTTAEYTTVVFNPVVFTNPAGGSWPTGANWQGGIAPSGSSQWGDFSTLNLTANATVTLDGARTIGGLTFDDTTPSHNWTLNTGSAGPLTLTGPTGLPVITVGSQTATINAVLAGTQGLTKSGAGTLVLGGANTFTGQTVINTGTLEIGGAGKLGNGTYAGAVSNNGTFKYNSSAAQTLSGVISAAGTLTKDGAGTLTLSGADSYTGGTTLYGGTLAWNNAASFGSGTLTLSGGTLKGINNLTATNAISVTTGTTTLIDSTSVNAIYSGALSGSGTLNVNPTSGTGGNVVFSGNESGFTGTLAYVNTVSKVSLRLEGSATNFSNAKWSLSGSIDPTSANSRGIWWFGTAGSIIQVGELSGTGGVIGKVSNGYGNSFTLQVGALNTSSSYAGIIVNGAGASVTSLIKVGTGTQIFSGANTYTGATSINGGALLINGSLANTATTVAAGGALGGTGSIAGTVTNNGTLAPGSNGIGTLTVNNTLSLSGTTTMEVSNSSGTLTADKLSGVSTVTFGGALVITNVGPSALVTGNTFTLFSATTRTGSFSTITLPALASGLAWDTSQLSVNGTISVTTLPSGWAAGDIGSVGLAGSVAYNSSAGSYTVSGSGSDIGGTADGFQSVSQTLVGDGEIRARVTSQANTDAWAKAGVMIRDGSGAGAVNALMAITPGNGFTFQSRSNVSGSTTSVTGPALNTAPNNWVRLTRSGTLVTAYSSADGANWTQVGTVNLTMASSVSVGLAVTSHNNTVLSTATFDNVSITPFPVPWVTADIGTTGLTGSAEYFGSAFTVKGAGTFGGTTDAFRYTYQTLTADGSIVARVSNLQDTGTSARVGVMIRDSLAGNSRMAALTVNGSGTWTWENRATTGGSVSTSTGSSGTAPNLWVKLVRSGDTFTASGSTDGTNWTTIGSATVTMASNCYIGLGVASGSTTTLNTSEFSNVSVTP